MGERVSDERLKQVASLQARAAATYALKFDEDVLAIIDELLDRRAADAWQAEPSEEGWYWIDGIDIPCHMHKADAIDSADVGMWAFSGFTADGDGFDHRPLNGRRVRQIRRGE